MPLMKKQDNPTPSSSSKKQGKGRWLGLKPTQFLAALMPVIFLAGLGTGYLIWGRAQTQPAQDDVTRYDVSVDDDPSIGPEDAPVTIIEFADYNCGYCRRFYQDTFEALMDAYPNKIRFVYRDYPIVGGLLAAESANCAGEQGAYWEYHDALFSGSNSADRAGYLAYAQDLGLDVTAFTECLDSGRQQDEVIADAQFAANLGISSTPTFFINGIPIVGARPLDSFVQIVESELKR
jgi:protein-disulfide isomerase